MREVDRTKTYACERIYYMDNDGKLVERIIHDGKQISAQIDANKEAASQTPKRGNLRQVAEIPAVTVLGWLHEAGIPGWCSDEALDLVINKKLRDPDNKYFLTVPDNYRMMRHG